VSDRKDLLMAEYSVTDVPRLKREARLTHRVFGLAKGRAEEAEKQVAGSIVSVKARHEDSWSSSCRNPQETAWSANPFPVSSLWRTGELIQTCYAQLILRTKIHGKIWQFSVSPDDVTDIKLFESETAAPA
jgi:hypothetical protein